MSADRYVLLGLAQPRVAWFAAVAQWANASSIPAEFVKCLSAEEVRSRLASERPFSALLVDGALPSVDRDLLDAAGRAGCPVLVVADDRVTRDWAALGATAVLGPRFDRERLLDILNGHAARIAKTDPLTSVTGDSATSPDGLVVAFCGPGGTGTSSSAIGLAQGLAVSPPGPDHRGGPDGSGRGRRPAHLHSVVLADLSRHGEMAMLHDARDVIPGLQELVEAHRSGRPALDEIPAYTFAIEERGYFLLLGLRRAAAWPALRPRAVEAAVTSLQEAFSVVVCDIDPEFDGEHETGSVDVEEMHTPARLAARRASVVFAVGTPGFKGLHALTRVVRGLLDFGVPAGRIVPVINRAPRRGRVRGELAQSFTALVPPGAAGSMPAPLFLPERPIDDDLRDGVRLPAAFCDPLCGAVRAVLARTGPRDDDAEPALVRPGSLGQWLDDEAGADEAGPDEAAVG